MSFCFFLFFVSFSQPIFFLLFRKADNVLIDKHNTALVTDFGLSKAKVLTMMNPAGAPTLAGRVASSAKGRNKYHIFVEFSEIAGTPR